MKLIRPALAIFGTTLMLLAVLMLLPAALILLGDAPNFRVFTSCALITAFTGFVLQQTNRNVFQHLTTQKVFLITAINWIGVSGFVAIPFIFSSLHLSFTDAVFESVSGVTTTGSTVLSGLDSLPHDLLLWHSISQWVGGIGIPADNSAQDKQADTA